MIVLVMSKIPSQLRGYVSRFLLEVNTGVFVGDCTQRVREGIWSEIESNDSQDSSSIMIWSDDTKEQGFDFTSRGYNRECNLDGFIAIIHKNTQDQKDNSYKKKGWSKASKYRRYAR